MDNVAVTPGAGATIACDDIGGIQHQRVKVVIGADGVSDGDVSSSNPMPIAALSVVPGTGATNLGKATAATAGATDTGVVLLGKRADAYATASETTGQYSPLRINQVGEVIVDAAGVTLIDGMNATTGWSILGNDTGNLATSTNHILGTNSLTFDKLNGAANTIFAGIQKTITSVDLSHFDTNDIISMSFYVSSVTDVAYAFIRLGTDASNYNEWRVADTSMTAGSWQTPAISIGSPAFAGSTGSGWNPAAVTYVTVGVAFDVQSNTLDGIIFDHIILASSDNSTAQLTAEVTSSVSSPNVKINGYGGSTDTNNGNASANTLRVVNATDDVNLAAQTTALQLIDNIVSGTGANISQLGGVATPMGAGTEAGALRVTVATDSTGVLSVDDNGGSLTVDGTVAVTGTVAVSAASLPLPTGATTAALQTAGNASLSNIDTYTANLVKLRDTGSGGDHGVPALFVRMDTPANGTATDGYYDYPQMSAGRIWTSTIVTSGSVSISASALPSGASTAAKQPALGTAGTASADVITVQGIASMTALKVDGSAVTQPVSGTVTANQGGTWTVQPGNTANTTAWKVDGSAVTQPVSGTVAFSNTTIAVTNAGTFATQATTATATGNTTMQNAVAATGNGTSLTVTGYGTALLTVTGTFTATINFEGSTDSGTTWFDVSATKVGTSQMAVTATTTGQYRLTTAGFDLIRARVTWTSGTSVTVIGRATNSENASKIVSISTNSIAKAEDTASADGDIGVPAMARRTATPANTSGTDLDYEMLQMNAGRLWTNTLLGDGTTNVGVISGTTALKTDLSSVAGTATVTAGVNGLPAIGGAAAHAASISGNPVRKGFRALTADYTAVTTGQTADAISTVLGKQVTMPYALPGATWKYVGAAGGIVTTTAITIAAAAGAGVKNYITSILLVNSHQSIGTEVVINDGAAGTAIFRTWCQYAGGGCALNFVPPLASTANTLLEIKEITATATAGVVVEVIGYTAAE